MNIADELAATTKKKLQIDTEYEKLWEKLFQELSKYLSFIDTKYFNTVDKIFYYEDENYESLNTFKTTIFFNIGQHIENPITTIKIKSNYDDSFLITIISQFCVANNLVFE